MRAVAADLKTTFGPDRCCRLIESKKKWTWFIIDGDGTDCYYLSSYSMWRTSTGVQDDLRQWPIAFTPHFIERHIQSTRHANDVLTWIALKVCEALGPLHQARTISDGRQRPYWKAIGNIWIAMPEYLLLGDMPEYGDVVLRTLIRAEALDRAKQSVWEQLRQAGCHAAVFRDGQRVA